MKPLFGGFEMRLKVVKFGLRFHIPWIGHATLLREGDQKLRNSHYIKPLFSILISLIILAHISLMLIMSRIVYTVYPGIVYTPVYCILCIPYTLCCILNNCLNIQVLLFAPACSKYTEWNENTLFSVNQHFGLVKNGKVQKRGRINLIGEGKN